MTAFHETPSTGPCADLAAQFQALVPVLETDRLVLRAPRIEDFGTFADAVLSERGHFFGHPQNRGDAWYEFIQLNVTWMLRGHGAWTVTDRATGAPLGFVHIGAEPGDMEAELGYVMTADAEGKSIAYEACVAVRDYAYDGLGFTTLVSCVDPGNARSAALATRLGAARDPHAEAMFDDGPNHIYRHIKPGGPQ
ncbi:MAG: GNAT family N-acetyltransferase [Pseudomonadota bacterium]